MNKSINLSISKPRKSLLRTIPMEDKAKTETPIKRILSLPTQSLTLPITRTVDARAIRNQFRTPIHLGKRDMELLRHHRKSNTDRGRGKWCKKGSESYSE